MSLLHADSPSYVNLHDIMHQAIEYMSAEEVEFWKISTMMRTTSPEYLDYILWSGVDVGQIEELVINIANDASVNLEYVTDSLEEAINQEVIETKPDTDEYIKQIAFNLLEDIREYKFDQRIPIESQIPEDLPYQIARELLTIVIENRYLTNAEISNYAIYMYLNGYIGLEDKTEEGRTLGANLANIVGGKYSLIYHLLESEIELSQEEQEDNYQLSGQYAHAIGTRNNIYFISQIRKNLHNPTDIEARTEAIQRRNLTGNLGVLQSMSINDPDLYKEFKQMARDLYHTTENGRRLPISIILDRLNERFDIDLSVGQFNFWRGKSDAEGELNLLADPTYRKDRAKSEEAPEWAAKNMSKLQEMVREGSTFPQIIDMLKEKGYPVVSGTVHAYIRRNPELFPTYASKRAKRETLTAEIMAYRPLLPKHFELIHYTNGMTTIDWDQHPEIRQQIKHWLNEGFSSYQIEIRLGHPELKKAAIRLLGEG